MKLTVYIIWLIRLFSGVTVFFLLSYRFLHTLKLWHGFSFPYGEWWTATLHPSEGKASFTSYKACHGDLTKLFQENIHDNSFIHSYITVVYTETELGRRHSGWCACQ